MKNVLTFLGKITVDDLRAWAGPTIYNRGKSYVDNVYELSRTEDGALAAWVSGTDEYATSVGPDPDGELEWVCSCPYDYGGPCKHVVAVVLAAAQAVKRKLDLPLLDAESDLSHELFDPDDAEDVVCPDEVEEPMGGRRGRNRKNAVAEIIGRMSREGLERLLADFAGRFPRIEREILETDQLASGRADKIVSSLRREIRNLTAEPAWRSRWNGEGNLPDYSPVHKQLDALLARGHADDVLQLGEELWTRGNEQVAQSNDGGATHFAISECLDVVLRALPRTSLSPAQQLLWMIDRELADEYALLNAAGNMDREEYAPEHWREVADSLELRLKSMPKPTSTRFTDTYDRSKLVDILCTAYERGGQAKKILPLLEQEADPCCSYRRLVDLLIQSGDRDSARKWCVHGYHRMIERAPGTAAELQICLREMAHQEKKHDLVAAYRAEDFLDRPSREHYVELRKAAEKAKLWSSVREGVLRYLGTGRRPDEGKSCQWQLPPTELTASAGRARKTYETFPNIDMLIDIAIYENRLADVVTLYQRLRLRQRWGFQTDKAVADAVAATHPDLALEIWRAVVDHLIAQVKPKAYEEAAVYLRHMREVFQETDRRDGWLKLLGELRIKHKAKRRLQEVLDGLADKGYVSSITGRKL